jgi:hypothetical protein
LIRVETLRDVQAGLPWFGASQQFHFDQSRVVCQVFIVRRTIATAEPDSECKSLETKKNFTMMKS